MCGETRIPRDMCAGNTLPGETYITVTPALVGCPEHSTLGHVSIVGCPEHSTLGDAKSSSLALGVG